MFERLALLCTSRLCIERASGICRDDANRDEGMTLYCFFKQLFVFLRVFLDFARNKNRSFLSLFE